jgi:hypothetical protein
MSHTCPDEVEPPIPVSGVSGRGINRRDCRVISRKIASQVQHESMHRVWISDYWDGHLSGLCRHNGELCRFEIECDEDGDCPKNATYTIYTLSPLEKLRWLWRKKKFEICVGRHWTYPDRKNGVQFRRRKPRWLDALLWAWQYGDIRGAFRFYYRVK